MESPRQDGWDYRPIIEVLPGSRARPRGVSFVNCLRAIDETHLYSGLAHNGGNIAKQPTTTQREEAGITCAFLTVRDAVQLYRVYPIRLNERLLRLLKVKTAESPNWQTSRTLPQSPIGDPGGRGINPMFLVDVPRAAAATHRERWQ